jgi:hypothetical protein
VAHIGQELRLVLAGDLELPALVLDLLEELRVLDRQDGLAGEGAEQVDGAGRELAALAPVEHERAEHALGADQRHDQHRMVAGGETCIAQRHIGHLGKVCDLHRFALPHGATHQGLVLLHVEGADGRGECRV